jgi:seryl-tRNA synthetase
VKARRNELSQQVGALKKTGQDATAVMEETRALKDELDEPGPQGGAARRGDAAVAGAHSQPDAR